MKDILVVAKLKEGKFDKFMGFMQSEEGMNERRKIADLTKTLGTVSPDKNAVMFKIVVHDENALISFLDGSNSVSKPIFDEVMVSYEIFELNRKHDLDAEKFIDDFKVNLAMSLSSIINILDPDAFIFGGGVSNEIDFLHEIDSLVRKFVIGREYEGVFLKPRYGDASGVRGAARLGRSATY